MAFDLGLTLFTEGGALTQAKQMEALLECNAATAAYGLQLTPAQAQALLGVWSWAAGLAAYLRRSVPLLAADLVKNLSLGRLEMTVPCPAEWEAR